MRSWKMSRFGRLKRLGYIPEDCTIEEFVQLHLSGGNLKPEETRSIVKMTGKTLNEKLREEGYDFNDVTGERGIGRAVQQLFDVCNPREVRVIKASEVDPGRYGGDTKTFFVYSKSSVAYKSWCDEARRYAAILHPLIKKSTVE